MENKELENIYLYIDSVESFIIEKTKTKDLQVNSDKIEEFKNIKQFISEIKDDNIYIKIMNQLKLLEIQMDVFTTELAAENFKMDDFKRLSIIYFLLLKTDINQVLSIIPDQLYLTINSMRGVPYHHYVECIDKLTYSKLVEIMNTEGPTETIRIVLNALTDKIVNINHNYDKTNLENDMESFIVTDVYSRIEPAMTGNRENDLLLKLQADKSFNLKNIENAKRVNPSLYHESYEEKLDALGQYDKMVTDYDTTQKYLSVIDYLQQKTDSRAFAMTKLELTTLKLMSYIDIHELEVGDIAELVIKSADISVDNYEELFHNENLKLH